MKFGKEFVSQMVPEWQEAYMNYNSLKSILKDMLKFIAENEPKAPMASTPKGSLKRRLTLYRAFSGLNGKQRHSSSSKSEDEVILIRSEEGEDDSKGLYKTMFLKPYEVGAEKDLVFFRNLDIEFNKVNAFYKKMMKEVVGEAEELSMQMNFLIALRIKVDKVGFGNVDSSGNSSSTSTMNLVNDAKHGHSSIHLDMIHEVEMSNESQFINDKDGNYVAQTNSKTNSIEGFRPASLEILDHVKINVITPETPVSTIKGLLLSSKSDKTFDKKELRKADDQLSTALKEFYHKLRLLKRYSFLNLLAFSKIMKKYDKVNRLIERVEHAFIKHFANGNHRKGMNTLRPTAKRERHRKTFLLGLLTGCSIALIVALILLIHVRNIPGSLHGTEYMENIFPLYCLFGYIVLHMIIYSGNTYFWRRFKINYPFIFGFKEGTELGYREVFLVSSGLAVLSLAGALSNLYMELDKRTQNYQSFTELVPLGLVIVVLVITFCPFNIIYKSSRFFLIKCAFHSICAPLYKVHFPDNFLADQLTSQCLRRLLLEERNIMHGLNGLKYISTIVALTMRTISDQFFEGNMVWTILAASSSAIATIANTYWDIVIDWGLLRRDSRNPWLRDKLSVPYKCVYFVAMVLNVLLRLAWMQSVLGIRETPFLHKTAMTAFVACLEILRRGIWNFFRMENEHLNNVGKYRAFKSVPLPFNYQDDDEESSDT
ncbi:phosphate transporter PHO1 protein [Trifolium repens]|nr:phosphate transporter PHO1 protein [Trifolium repens]